MKYWKIVNAENKCWLIPTKNAKTALEIYQPSSRNGILLKKLLPLFSHISSIWSPFEIVDDPIDKQLVEFISKMFPGKELTISAFLGTPCVHQKATIQISEGEKLVAYCKYSDSKDVTELFDKEQSLLNKLEQAGICHVPRCLYNSKPTDFDKQVFVMTTEKTLKSEVVHEWTENHEQFIKQLKQRTKQLMKYEDTDYCKRIQILKARINDLPECVDASAVEKCIEEISQKYAGKEIEAVAMHGDFTPWNMFRQNGHLFVFDWEYAMQSTPVNLDKYHFYTQHSFFENHWTAEQMTSNAETSWMDKEEYKMYVVMIMSVFVCREKGKCSNTPLFAMWNELLKKLAY